MLSMKATICYTKHYEIIELPAVNKIDSSTTPDEIT